MADQLVLVLGSGYIGSAVTSRLSRDHIVETRDIPEFPELALRNDQARRLVLDLVERGASTVVNTAGRLRGTDEELNDANAEFPRWLVEVLAGSGARLIHLGSAAEYGDPGSPEPVAEDSPANPTGTYAQTKWAGTSAVLDGAAASLDAIVARPFNLVSRVIPPVSPVHQFIRDVSALPPEGGEVELWWPQTVRDFCFLDDLADWIAVLVDLDTGTDAKAEAPPRLVNLCSGIGIEYGEISRAVAAFQGKPLTIRSLERPGIKTVIGDPSRLRELVGELPAISASAIAERCNI